jgi:hypothetical protein
MQQKLRRTIVKKMICVAAFVVALFSLAVAQDTKFMPPATANLNVLRTANTAPNVHSAGAPPFCKGSSCLYYAGDFDSTDSNANGLFNANDSSAGLSGFTWVGVKPTKAATVTGATFNEFFTSGFSGTNPAPFQTQTGITNGAAGKVVCNTSGNATLKVYGESDFGLTQYSFTVKKLAKSCKIPAPTKKVPSTYVNLQPQSSNGYGYTVNVEDAKPANHHGWKNDLDDCYFNGAAFGVTYNTCNSQGSFDELSIALTGK